jgi:glycosyltransferase involved in cell wall biosynthesis
LVSIAMPVRNNATTLAPAVRSILTQTYPRWELWLMDDGSTDGTLEQARAWAAADPRIRVQADGQGRGISARLNQAVDLARGPLFARMDGDDIAYPQRLERQVAYLLAHPAVDLAGAWVVVFDAQGRARGKRTGPERHAAICAQPWAGFPIVHPTFVGRLTWFRRYRYNPRITYSQDQDLFLRSYRASTFANVPEILLGYREVAVQLNKTLTGRREFAGSLLREMRQGRLFLGLRGLAAHGGKAGAELLATHIGQAARLLRHRAMPLTSAERAVWEQVWTSVRDGPEVRPSEST